MDGRSMSEIHRIFGLDWSLRSFSASPWPLDQSRVNIFMFFPNSFTDQESWIEDTGFSQILALIWRRKYWHLDLISGRKTFSKRFGLRFGGVSVKCLTNDLWISPSVRSSEKSVCSSAFYPNFHPDPFAPTDPSIRYWHGGGRRTRRWESDFFMHFQTFFADRSFFLDI